MLNSAYQACVEGRDVSCREQCLLLLRFVDLGDYARIEALHILTHVYLHKSESEARCDCKIPTLRSKRHRQANDRILTVTSSTSPSEPQVKRTEHRIRWRKSHAQKINEGAANRRFRMRISELKKELEDKDSEADSKTSFYSKCYNIVKVSGESPRGYFFQPQIQTVSSRQQSDAGELSGQIFLMFDTRW